MAQDGRDAANMGNVYGNVYANLADAAQTTSSIHGANAALSTAPMTGSSSGITTAPPTGSTSDLAALVTGSSTAFSIAPLSSTGFGFPRVPVGNASTPGNYSIDQAPATTPSYSRVLPTHARGLARAWDTTGSPVFLGNGRSDHGRYGVPFNAGPFGNRRVTTYLDFNKGNSANSGNAGTINSSSQADVAAMAALINKHLEGHIEGLSTPGGVPAHMGNNGGNGYVNAPFTHSTEGGSKANTAHHGYGSDLLQPSVPIGIRGYASVDDLASAVNRIKFEELRAAENHSPLGTLNSPATPFDKEFVTRLYDGDLKQNAFVDGTTVGKHREELAISQLQLEAAQNENANIPLFSPQLQPGRGTPLRQNPNLARGSRRVTGAPSGGHPNWNQTVRHYRKMTPENQQLMSFMVHAPGLFRPQDDRGLLADIFDNTSTWSDAWVLKGVLPMSKLAAFADLPALAQLLGPKADRNTRILMLSNEQWRKDLIAGIVATVILEFTFTEAFMAVADPTHPYSSECIAMEAAWINVGYNDVDLFSDMVAQEAALYNTIKDMPNHRVWRAEKGGAKAKELVQMLSPFLERPLDSTIYNDRTTQVRLFFLRFFRIAFRFRTSGEGRHFVNWPRKGDVYDPKTMVNMSINLLGDTTSTLAKTFQEPWNFQVKYAKTPTMGKNVVRGNGIEQSVAHKALVWLEEKKPATMAGPPSAGAVLPSGVSKAVGAEREARKVLKKA